MPHALTCLVLALRIGSYKQHMSISVISFILLVAHAQWPVWIGTLVTYMRVCRDMTGWAALVTLATQRPFVGLSKLVRLWVPQHQRHLRSCFYCCSDVWHARDLIFNLANCHFAPRDMSGHGISGFNARIQTIIGASFSGLQSLKQLWAICVHAYAFLLIPCYYQWQRGQELVSNMLQAWLPHVCACRARLPYVDTGWSSWSARPADFGNALTGQLTHHRAGPLGPQPWLHLLTSRLAQLRTNSLSFRWPDWRSCTYLSTLCIYANLHVHHH